MGSYETQLVHELLSTGDLPGIDYLVRSLVTDVAAKLPTLHNPRSHRYLRKIQQGLKRFSELPCPPRRGHLPQSLEHAEIDLYIRRMVDLHGGKAIEDFLRTLSQDLTVASVIEPDADRSLWMSHAASLLDDDVTIMCDGYGEILAPDHLPERVVPKVTRVVSVSILTLILLAMAAAFLLPFTSRF
jgi:hypothetical protein